ncbi:MAG: hypothetical protein ABI761_13715 [Saprospiraceae bacterium]
MKSKNKIKAGLLLFTALLYCFQLTAQDSLRRKVSLTIRYFSEENKSMYVLSTAKTKINGRFKTLPGISMTAYLDEEIADNFIDSAITDEHGEVKIYLPLRLKDLWTSTANHTFIINSKENDTTRSGQGELTITKAKLFIDTLSDGTSRNIKISASAWNGKTWEPIKGLEIKPGVQRHGGMLKVTDEESYTTDSTGSITAEFKDTTLPGDEYGNIVLGAKVEDNDTYGNLLITKEAPWGRPVLKTTDFFDQRTLWTTRFRTPYWLLFIVYGMAIGIWGSIISVIRSLVKTIKLGKE